MRHAKSDWAEEGLADHDRPLNKRGRRDAPHMAQWLAEQDAIPSVILASTATRVAQTVERMVEQWPHEPLILRSSTLYHASPHIMLDVIRNEAFDAHGERPQRLLVVGHNPGLSQLVSSLAGAEVFMPTAAIALFACQPIDPHDHEAPRIESLLTVGRPKEI